MPVCPKGHTSVAVDYCDECGAPIGASSSTESSSAAPASASPSAGSSSGAPSATGGSSSAAAQSAPGAATGGAAARSSDAPAAARLGDSGAVCPECGTVRDGRFCEVCGHDFLAVPAATPARPATPAGSASGGSAAATAASGAASSGGEASAAGSSAPARWRVIVTADRAYHERMAAAADEGAERLAFPAYCPERRFELTGDEILIGRHSRSRGIEPAVDLTGPPEDAGVSHMHALLVRTPAGTWTVVDLDSANGTYVNEATDPIEANKPTPVADGDRIHVGAWTTLTLRAA